VIDFDQISPAPGGRNNNLVRIPVTTTLFIFPWLKVYHSTDGNAGKEIPEGNYWHKLSWQGGFSGDQHSLCPIHPREMGRFCIDARF